MDKFDPVASFLSQLDPLVRLKAENANLRKELEAEHALAETLGHYHEAAKAENEKLRMLVRGLDYCTEELNSAECDKCPLGDNETLRPTCERMMEELGLKKYGGKDQ